MDEEEEEQNEKNEKIKLEKEKQIAAGKEYFCSCVSLYLLYMLSFPL